jgi:prepilin signal peptidase PulO-like enzyme (type II secretory pathway)
MLVSVALFILGLTFGSFINALVWRMHEQAEQTGKKASKKHTQYLKELSITKGRSMCPDCHHQLAARDLVPVFSWLALGGKCRYCRQPISPQYPLVELLTAALFVFSYVFWPSAFHGAGLLEFILWLVFLVGFVALAVYDLKWFLLPNRIVYPLLGLAILQVLAVVIFYHGGLHLLLSSVWGALVGGGLFYALFQISGGKWIGGGDVKLGSLLGILVGGPLAAGLLLFTASLAGTVFALPLMAAGKVKRTTLVPFGPFLLLAALIVRLFGASVITWLQTRYLLPK